MGLMNANVNENKNAVMAGATIILVEVGLGRAGNHEAAMGE